MDKETKSKWGVILAQVLMVVAAVAFALYAIGSFDEKHKPIYSTTTPEGKAAVIETASMFRDPPPHSRNPDLAPWVEVHDGCEYLCRGNSMAHKGNCKNPLHYRGPMTKTHHEALLKEVRRIWGDD
jgi:hypothetical protein